MMRGIWLSAAWCAGCAACGGWAAADVVEIPAAADNTLYESDIGHLSNGAGSYFFAGVTATLNLRRGVIRFDVAQGVPEGATITGATLRLYMSKSMAGDSPVSLHRAMAAWGEGASDAVMEEGSGAPAEPGDATWIHTFYDADLWSAPGGDFDPAASATIDVAFEGFYEWSTDAMAGDVQAWLDDPGSGYGWVVVGDETGAGTTKRFNSREHEDGATRPVLVVTFEAGACYADCDGSGDVNLFDFFCFVGAFNAGDEYADCDASGGINLFDFFCFVGAFNGGC